MDGRRPRDWDRCEREARIWSRKFERGMKAFGERMEQDFKDGGAQFARDPQASSEEARRDGGGRRHTGPTWAWDWDWDQSPRARRAARRAARHAARAAAHAAADGVARGMAGARAAARAERRAARCGSGMGWWASYWWVVFPLFFVGKNAFEDAGGFVGLSQAVQNSIGSSLEFTLAAPIAHLLERLTGMSFVEAFALLALSGAVSTAAGLIAWRMGRPQGEAQLQ